MLKDEFLNSLAEHDNIAQFVSFAPTGEQRFVRICGMDVATKFSSLEEAVAVILKKCNNLVNIRTFLPEQPSGNPFHYGLDTAEKVLAHARQELAKGLFIIIHETIDVNDGGLGGIVFDGGYLEFAPGVCPRFVEGTPENPIPVFAVKDGLQVIKTIYGFAPNLPVEDSSVRMEVSLHPNPVGYRHERIITWESGKSHAVERSPFYIWPNAVSKMIGDKAYGLVMAHVFGIKVPYSTVYTRDKRIAPFSFGEKTSSDNVWTRTCPRIQEPGKFSTFPYYSNPYMLMETEDPENQHLASVIVQHEIVAAYAGAFFVGNDDKPVVEGVKGNGDSFMLGEVNQALPEAIVNDVLNLYNSIAKIFGPVRFEWVHDGKEVWIVQLHKGKVQTEGRRVYPGNPEQWLIFKATDGLEQLRALVDIAIKSKAGIKIIGNVGMASHMADLLRANKVPSEVMSEV